jgi:hypothetical protein
MRWDDSHESPDVVDRRGEGPSGGGGGSGLFFLVFWLLRRPWGWVVLIVGGIGYFALRQLGAFDAADSRALHGGQSGPGAPADPDAREVHFVGFVLDDVQTTWSAIFAQGGRPYRHAKLVLYTDETRTACGEGSAATGPFYCPDDEQVYLDLGFFHELSAKRRELRVAPPAARCDSSFRPIAMRASGPIRAASGTCSNRATSTRRSARQPPSGTTASSAWPREP